MGIEEKEKNYTKGRVPIQNQATYPHFVDKRLTPPHPRWLK